MPAYPHHGSSFPEIIPLPFNFHPAAVHHGSVRFQVIPDTIHLFPSGNHISTGIKVVILSIDFFPSIFRIGSIFMAVPPSSSVFLPSLHIFRFSLNPDTVSIYILIPNPGILCHCASVIHIVIRTSDLMPAFSKHGTVWLEIIPIVVYLFPADGHISLFIKPVPV